MKAFTKEQGIIITGYTGYMACEVFGDFHKDVEKRLGRSVFTHELASKGLADEISELYKDDFISLIKQ